MGNSQGVIIPKPVLAQVGLETEAELLIQKDALILRRPAARPRAGWAEASKRLASTGGDELVWPEFGNEGDRDLKW